MIDDVQILHMRNKADFKVELKGFINKGYVVESFSTCFDHENLIRYVALLTKENNHESRQRNTNATKCANISQYEIINDI
jgi:hypothetical protein